MSRILSTLDGAVTKIPLVGGIRSIILGGKGKLRGDPENQRTLSQLRSGWSGIQALNFTLPFLFRPG